MSFRISRFFKIENYISRIKLVKKKLEIIRISKKNYYFNEINYIWQIDQHQLDNNKNFNDSYLNSNKYYIFGNEIDLNNINWHQDRFSGFEYPKKRFDKINASQYFDKGIELVFPWEQSRFYFVPLLAQKYLVSGNKVFYNQFRSLVVDWIDKNPFQYGVNWLSTMDVAIRAANWIVGINLFQNEFGKDSEFQKIISRSLHQHAVYISAFPAIYAKGRITNHTTSAYFGLLFLALTLKQNEKSKSWLKQAIDGLEKCIEVQVYNDGIDFEGSISYHRLVLEIFAYSAICAESNGYSFSNKFYNKLFKMFEFSAAYMDKKGNAPQVGDNDSGRAIIFLENFENNPYSYEHNHSYLLNLGNHIFNYDFNLNKIATENNFIKYLPHINKINFEEINITPRKTNQSIKFEDGGAYILKNDKFDLLVSCFPIGQGGYGGHNNLDCGSFTLSINGNPFVVDPGTPFYSSDKKIRDKFRSYDYHNTIFTEEDKNINMLENGYWSLKEYYEYKLLTFNENEIEIEIIYKPNDHKRYRKFILKEDELIIENKIEGKFEANINFPPEVKIISKSDFEIMTNFGKINLKGAESILIKDSNYSPHYGKILQSSNLIAQAKDKVIHIIK